MSLSGKHIVIITGQHMVANPRVWKEANTLAVKGYRVTILTTFYDTVKVEQDKALLHPFICYQAVVNITKGVGSFQDVYLSRIGRKIALLTKKYLRQDSAALLLYLPKKQIKLAFAKNADLYIAHQETGLIVGVELLKLGKKVAFDIEDWYSRDYLNDIRPVKLLTKYESYALLHGKYVTCPSKSMAEALISVYQTTKTPIVIFNSFSSKENTNNFGFERPSNSLIWFSQVVGPSRGLETLMDALKLVKESLVVHLVGKCDLGYKDFLLQLMGRSIHQLYFHDAVNHFELLPLISQFNIGLAIENNFPDNRDTTITNKIFQYIQAGNKVLATNTKGQAELSESFKDVIALVDVNQPKQFAAALLSLINRPTINLEYRLQYFNRHFAWEAQELKIIDLVFKAVF